MVFLIKADSQSCSYAFSLFSYFCVSVSGVRMVLSPPTRIQTLPQIQKERKKDTNIHTILLWIVRLKCLWLFTDAECQVLLWLIVWSKLFVWKCWSVLFPMHTHTNTGTHITMASTIQNNKHLYVLHLFANELVPFTILNSCNCLKLDFFPLCRKQYQRAHIHTCIRF